MYLGCSFVYLCKYVRVYISTSTRYVPPNAQQRLFYRSPRRVKFQTFFRWKRKLEKLEKKIHLTRCRSINHRVTWSHFNSFQKQPKPIMPLTRKSNDGIFWPLCNQSLCTNSSRRYSSCSSRYIYHGQDRDRFLKSNRAPLDDKTSSLACGILTRATVYPALSGRRVKWPVKGRRIEKKAGKRRRARSSSRLSNNFKQALP